MFHVKHSEAMIQQDIISVGGGNKDLPFHTIAEEVKEEAVSITVKFTGDIIKQQNGRKVVALFKV